MRLLSHKRIPVIDGLRGIAIIMVIFHHLYSNHIVYGKNGFLIFGIPISPFSIISNGNQGVVLFFILSGFVLTLPFVNGKRSFSSTRNVLDFYRRRFLRLVPLFFVSVMFTAYIFRPPGILFGKDVLPLLTFIGPFSNYTHFPRLNVVFWSLEVEFWFCLLFPLLIFIMNRAGNTVFFIGVIFLSFIVRLLPYTNLFFLSGGVIFSRIDTFAAGMSLAVLYTQNKLKSSTALWLSGIGFLFLGFSYFDFSTFPGSLFWYGSFSSFFLVLGFFFIITQLLEGKQSLIIRFVSSWPLQLLGMMCYSLYLWHTQILKIFDGRTSLGALFIYILFLLLFSFLSYRFLEFPTRPLKSLFPPIKSRSPSQPTEQTGLNFISDPLAVVSDTGPIIGTE